MNSTLGASARGLRVKASAGRQAGNLRPGGARVRPLARGKTTATHSATLQVVLFLIHHKSWPIYWEQGDQDAKLANEVFMRILWKAFEGCP